MNETTPQQQAYLDRLGDRVGSDRKKLPEVVPFEPFEGRLVVVMEDVEEKKGMLYVPDTAKDAPSTGTVLAVGPFSMNEAEPPIQAQVGDRILFAKYAGSEIDWKDDRTYLFIRHSDVVARVKE